MMLSVKGLHTFYGKIHALKGIDLEINEGEIVTLVGSNGAGKSTLLNTITGLVHGSQGSIEFQGKNTFNMAPHNVSLRPRNLPSVVCSGKSSLRCLYPKGYCGDRQCVSARL